MDFVISADKHLLALFGNNEDLLTVFNELELVGNQDYNFALSSGGANTVIKYCICNLRIYS